MWRALYYQEDGGQSGLGSGGSGENAQTTSGSGEGNGNNSSTLQVFSSCTNSSFTIWMFVFFSVSLAFVICIQFSDDISIFPFYYLSHSPLLSLILAFQGRAISRSTADRAGRRNDVDGRLWRLRLQSHNKCTSGFEACTQDFLHISTKKSFRRVAPLFANSVLFSFIVHEQDLH